MRQSDKVCYGIAMDLKGKSVVRILMVTLFVWGTVVTPSWADEKKQNVAQEAPAPKGSQTKTVELESIQEHFDEGMDTRTFPMTLFPQNTNATLLLTAAGVGLVSCLLTFGGGTIAAVNYEKQSRPDVLPVERLSARDAGRVGLGVAAAGLISMFAPPLLVDLALPKYVKPPAKDLKTSKKQDLPKSIQGEVPQNSPPATEPPVKKTP